MSDISKPRRFLMLGDTIMDFVARAKEPGAPRQYIPFGGGAIANVARHLASAQHSVEFITAFAPDPFGVMLRRELKELGVELKYAQTIAESESPMCFISNSDDGERYFLHRGGDPYRELSMSAHDLNLAAYDYFIWGISSVRTAESRFLIDGIMQDSDALVVCDPGTCPAWWGAPEALKVHLSERLPKIDILKCSQPEALWLSGLAHPGAAAQWLASKGPGLVIVTAGAEGLFACFSDDKRSVQVPTTPVRALDTTGAGDATLAGFLDYIAQRPNSKLTEHAVPALEAGSVWGAKTVQFQGAGPWQLS